MLKMIGKMKVGDIHEQIKIHKTFGYEGKDNFLPHHGVPLLFAHSPEVS